MNKKENKMKACMVAYTFYEGDNRVRRYAETLQRRGDEVDAIVLRQDDHPDFAKVAGVNVYKIQKRSINEKYKIEYLFKLVLFLIRSFFTITKLSIRKKYDLIHVHSVPDFEVFATILAKLTGTKVILDIHDVVPELFASKFHASNGSILFKMLLFMERLSMAYSDHVIIANHIWHERVISRSVSPYKCTVVMNYPDPVIFKKSVSPVKPKDKFILIYPGTLSIHQGIETAIKAVNILRDKIPEIEFHIYGKGTDEEYFIDLVKKLKLEQMVHFKNIVPIEKLPEVICSADVGVEPKFKNSFSNEAFSTKILEFMQMGIPVIASDTLVHTYYFNNDLVRFFHSGDEADLAKSILMLRNRKKIRETLIMNASRYMEQNNWDAKKHIYLDLVDSLVKKKRAVSFTYQLKSN
jgi:glycosyltransferase involved in cell wall biosynthesis